MSEAIEAPNDFKNLRQISEPVRDFVGRGKEIRDLLAAFEGAGQGAVISGVRGMGGVGKTELAKVLAKRLKKRFPDGQISFNLRGASDEASSKPATPVEALQHVIRSFYPEARLPEDVDPLRGLYHSILDGKRALLLMDNALDAQQLAPLVPPPDGCALMVTSRHRFALPGMTEIDLDTLPPEDARELLLGICPRIGGHADALAERCGHLPLALRLAASALNTHPMLGVENYLNDLGSEQGRLAALDAYKDSTNEARGIEASLAISYRLLDVRSQRYWRALSVFPGDFDAPAAGSVWQLKEEKHADEDIADTCTAAGSAAQRPPQDAARPLGDLYAASMVLWDEATNRFRLHDLARDYARAQLSEKKGAGDAQSHAAHYAGVLRRTSELYLEGGDAMLQGLALFDLEWGNIRAGQAWVGAHREADNTAAKLCSDYPDAGVYCLHLRLHPRDWIAWLEAALGAARKLKDREAEGSHLGNLGLAYADLGQTRKAIEYHEKALGIAREIGGRRGEGNALGNLGNAYYLLSEMRKAIEHYEQQLAVVREIGDRRGEGYSLGNLGTAYYFLGELRKAIEHDRQFLDIAREIGDRHSEGKALGNLGCAYADLGEPRKAIEYYERHLDIARQIGDLHGEESALGNLGRAYAGLGEPRKSIEYYEQALNIARDIGDRCGEGYSLDNLGFAYAALGETRKAIGYYEQALLIAREIGHRHSEGSALGNLGNAYAALGETQEAIAHAEQALEIFEQIESPYAAKARARLEELRK